MLFIHQMAAEKCERLFKASREVHNTEDNQYQQTRRRVTLQQKGNFELCVFFSFSSFQNKTSLLSDWAKQKE